MINKKLMSKAMAIAIMGITISTPILNTVNAMENNKNIAISENNKDVVEISDEEMLQAFLDAGIDNEILKEAGFYNKYKEGVNKSVKVKNGYDIYLSKSTLNTVKSGGEKALSVVLGKLIGGALSPIVGPLIYQVIKRAVPSVKGGMIFKMRVKPVYMGQYEGWVDMWVVDSYTYQ